MPNIQVSHETEISKLKKVKVESQAKPTSNDEIKKRVN
jgi:hypothetical protein